MSYAATHEVLNQPPPLKDYNLFEHNAAMQEGLSREGADWAEGLLQKFGAEIGRQECLDWGRLANENPPVFRPFDRYGHRIDQVEFHPAYHQLMSTSMRWGLHCLPWAEPKVGAHVARAAMMLLMSEVEYGHLCPISMTYSVVPSLRLLPALAKEWEPKIHSRQYDPTFAPKENKQGLTLGMAMTEKQGGSDVRANTTRAVPVGKGGPGGAYRLTGHKWFCSAPMSDAFLVLAQAPGGLSCFLLPRWTPEGKVNRFYIQRLKDKLGNRSNASSEVEFLDAEAALIGEEGRGVPTILEMVNHTRLDCVLGSTGLIRQSLVQALHHCRHRKAFGRLLIEQSLMKNVLADLCIESEAATLLALRLARAYDHPEESSFRRIATAVAKFWICKRNPMFVAEALECLGGVGYVEETGLARLYREAPLNSIWEGSGNVICLDVLRAIQREPESLDALMREIAEARGGDPRFDRHIKKLGVLLNDTDNAENQARLLVEQLALALQGSLLLRFGHPAVVRGFMESRLEERSGRVFGALPANLEFESLLDRNAVKV